jgi:DNA-binding protein HU-beta
MDERLNRDKLVQKVAERLKEHPDKVGQVVDATLEEIYEALKCGESVSLKNFGTFYIRPERETWVFKFNPSQRLRAIFGWSSTYKGPL